MPGRAGSERFYQPGWHGTVQLRTVTCASVNGTKPCLACTWLENGMERRGDIEADRGMGG